ncbi:MAG: methyltransferase domain-containing protein, partial [Pseudomonadota bacterium]
MNDNPFVSFYGEHGISPVHQDVRNIDVHIRRREKLYRMLGLPPVAFSKGRVLEVGPGGGHNALALFYWGASVDFVEPNPAAQAEIPELMRQHGIANNRWSIYPGLVETFPAEEQYDIVLAEGILPGLSNTHEVIAKLQLLVRNGGVVVVTCMDDISSFFENTKRIVAERLVRRIPAFPERVAILCKAFDTHLRSLRNATRPIEDWVADAFLFPTSRCTLFGMDDAMAGFGRDYHLLGSSPSLFVDYSWYKDLEYDARAACLLQFHRKRHALLHYDLEESQRSVDAN